MEDILDMLIQEIERNSSSRFYAQPGYRQRQFQALLHMNWLKEHLNEEEMKHLEQMQDADISAAALEHEALIRTALAVGIRLALPG